jgi:hypothetical protein
VITNFILGYPLTLTLSHKGRGDLCPPDYLITNYPNYNSSNLLGQAISYSRCDYYLYFRFPLTLTLSRKGEGDRWGSTIAAPLAIVALANLMLLQQICSPAKPSSILLL